MLNSILQNTMGILALGQSLLPLWQAASGAEKSPFDLHPWSLPIWRENFGLVPLRPADEDPEDIDLDYDDYQAGCADATDGFTLSKDAISNIQPSKLPFVSDHAVLRAASFFETFFLETVCTGIRRKQDAKSAIVHPHTQDCFEEFRGLALTMLSRPGGTMSIVKDVMADSGATPEHAWKDAREANRVSLSVIRCYRFKYLACIFRISLGICAWTSTRFPSHRGVNTLNRSPLNLRWPCVCSEKRPSCRAAPLKRSTGKL